MSVPSTYFVGRLHLTATLSGNVVSDTSATVCGAISCGGLTSVLRPQLTSASAPATPRARARATAVAIVLQPPQAPRDVGRRRAAAGGPPRDRGVDREPFADVGIECGRELAPLFERQVLETAPAVDAAPDRLPDHVVRLAERDALGDEIVGDVGCEEKA